VKKVGYMGGTKGIYIGMRPHFTFPRESTFHPFSPTPTTRRAASTYAHHHSSSSTRTRSELRHVRVYVLWFVPVSRLVSRSHPPDGAWHDPDATTHTSIKHTSERGGVLAKGLLQEITSAFPSSLELIKDLFISCCSLWTILHGAGYFTRCWHRGVWILIKIQFRNSHENREIHFSNIIIIPSSPYIFYSAAALSNHELIRLFNTPVLQIYCNRCNYYFLFLTHKYIQEYINPWAGRNNAGAHWTGAPTTSS
jgi:hypothetical protein